MCESPNINTDILMKKEQSTKQWSLGQHRLRMMKNRNARRPSTCARTEFQVSSFNTYKCAEFLGNPKDHTTRSPSNVLIVHWTRCKPTCLFKNKLVFPYKYGGAADCTLSDTESVAKTRLHKSIRVISLVPLSIHKKWA